MTPTYVRDVYARRGYAAAMAAANASQDQHLVTEVMLASLAATGIAAPKPVFKKNNRGGTSGKPSGFVEGCDPMKLAELRGELYRKNATNRAQPAIVQASRQPQPIRYGDPMPRRRGLTAEEVERRRAVLANARAA